MCKRWVSYLTALAVALSLSAFPVFAQHGGGHGGGPPMGGSGMGMGRSGMGPDSGMGRGGNMSHGGMMGDHQSPMMKPATSPKISGKSPTSLLSSNTKLNSTLQERLGSMLPKGMSLTDAASGFKNLGLFVAAVHVSHNLGIPFQDLKNKMTSGDSLGKAIHALKPDVKAKSAAKKGKRQAKADLKHSKG